MDFLPQAALAEPQAQQYVFQTQSSPGMDMQMDMGGGSTPPHSCKISMLWNWYTIDACFLARGWHIKSDAAMVVSCIGVMLMTVSLEFLRRLGKEYDAYVIRQFHAQAVKLDLKAHPAGGANGDASGPANTPSPPTEAPGSPQHLVFRASPLQQLGRAVIHAVTFGVAYIIMLLAMYFNGFIIISIFVGAGVGKYFCDWLVYKVALGTVCGPAGQDTNEHAIDEPTICCG